MFPLKFVVAATALLILAAPVSAQSRDADSYLADCTAAAEPSWCEAAQKTWPNDLAGAFAGDYQGLRNVAYCLSTGCNGSVEIDKREGCAWRALAYAAAPTGDDKILENNNMDAECKGVPQAEILAFVDAITPMLD